MSRELASALEVSAPAGFSEKPWTESYMKSTSEKFIRWSGKVLLPRDTNVVLKVPANQPMAGSGRMRFQCELNEKVVDPTIIIFANLETQTNPQN